MDKYRLSYFNFLVLILFFQNFKIIPQISKISKLYPNSLLSRWNLIFVDPLDKISKFRLLGRQNLNFVRPLDENKPTERRCYGESLISSNQWTKLCPSHCALALTSFSLSAVAGNRKWMGLRPATTWPAALQPRGCRMCKGRVWAQQGLPTWGKPQACGSAAATPMWHCDCTTRLPYVHTRCGNEQRSR